MGVEKPTGEAKASPAARALSEWRVTMKRVSAIPRIEIAAGECDLAERAQTLEFGYLIHEPSQERSFRDFPAKYGRCSRRYKPAACRTW